MKKTTINRIAKNSGLGRITYIGRYAYTVSWDELRQTWDISRCHKDALGREWIDHEGNIITGWTWLHVAI